MQNFLRLLIVAILASSLGVASWLTFGGDPQRSGWAKDESAITKANVNSLRLLWALKLENEAKELNALTAPLAINPVYTNHGSEDYVVLGGSSDNLFVIDANTGKLAWQKHFSNAVPAPHGETSYFCPNALNDTPVINGQSFNGAPTVYVISIDGKLHALNLINGEDRFPPAQFVPPYSKNWSLNLVGQTVYTSTSQGCGQAKSGVWAMDLTSPDKHVSFFQAAAYGGGIWGRGGVSLGAANVYAETGDGAFDPSSGKYADTVLSLAPKLLTVADYFTPKNATYLTRKDLDMGNSTPVVFPYKGRELLVASGKEGTLFLLDTKSMGGTTHREPLFAARYGNEENDIAGRGFWGAFATWEDPQGTRWVYAPLWGPVHSNALAFPAKNGDVPNGSIMAFKVEDKAGQPVLTPAWISHDMNLPEPPVVLNGVVLALSSGEFTRQLRDNGQFYSAKDRVENSTHATLYGFDAETGKELFSSGTSIHSFTHLGGLAVSDGRVFLTTHDSTVYAFGTPDE